jgi:uncharacterized protein (DUF4415 family)
MKRPPRSRTRKTRAARGSSTAPQLDPETFARTLARQGLTIAPKKSLLSLRIDSDVVEWFRRQGAGYQSRMNALLRAYMEAHK